jgi:signal transduction histidine kinase
LQDRAGYHAGTRHRPAAKLRSPARTGGLGPGLAIVKEIVDRHGGTVSIGSRDGGDGTRVCVSFPGA